MSDRIHVVPSEGLVVRDPASGLELPQAGKEVPNSTYWQRRLLVGDVFLKQATPIVRKRRPKTTENQPNEGTNE